MDPLISNGVVLVSEPDDYKSSETKYIQARSLEGRILGDEQVSALPFTSTDYLHHEEWNLRRNSYKRLLSVLKRKKPTTLLDIGCGNGWLVGNLANELNYCQLSGIDVNQVELEQASKLFAGERSRFYFLDLIDNSFFDPESFDAIIFNASIQYFDNLSAIIAIAKILLKSKGILLINDSPVYTNDTDSEAARLRSEAYYKQLGVPDMAKNYFHHNTPELIKLGFRKYHSWTTIITKCPFPLFIYSKP